MTKITTKRAYEPAEDSDGYRIYVDRLWPRGLSHETFHYDLWEKDIAPSTELREWFHSAGPQSWTEFEEKYQEELEANAAMAEFEAVVKKHPVVTLLYSSHDTVHNNAIVLRNFLNNKIND